MNIFLLDMDIETCAKYHNDKHVVKMITEGVQILSTCLHFYSLPAPYRSTHLNHPCCVWARKSLQNYQWLWTLMDNLGKEYTHRYDRTHLSHIRLLEQVPFIPNCVFIGSAFSLPPNCTPYKEIEDTVSAYRQYYLIDKKHFCRWTRRNIPNWFE